MRHPELAIDAKNRGIAFQPTRLAVQGLAQDPALTQPVAAQENQQVEIASGKSADDLFQFHVSGEVNPQAAKSTDAHDEAPMQREVPSPLACGAAGSSKGSSPTSRLRRERVVLSESLVAMRKVLGGAKECSWGIILPVPRGVTVLSKELSPCAATGNCKQYVHRSVCPLVRAADSADDAAGLAL